MSIQPVPRMTRFTSTELMKLYKYSHIHLQERGLSETIRSDLKFIHAEAWQQLLALGYDPRAIQKIIE